MLVVAGLGATGTGLGADQATTTTLTDPILVAMKTAGMESVDRRLNEVDVSRNFDRPEIKNRAADQAEQRAKALDEVDGQVQTRTAELKEEEREELEEEQKKADAVVKANEAEKVERQAGQWVLPVATYQLTAQYGQQSSLWSSGSHTGLDFAGPSGSEIVAIAKGTVVSAGYSGSYGFRTVIRLEDGTEVWYAHQSRITVNAGQEVQPGDLTGYTGATGNVTGPHLHLEIRPGGGDPVDPAAALKAHGVRP